MVAAAEVQAVAGCFRSLVRRDVLHERPLPQYHPDRCLFEDCLDLLSLLMAAHHFVVDDFDPADHHRRSSMDDYEWAFGSKESSVPYYMRDNTETYRYSNNSIEVLAHV